MPGILVYMVKPGDELWDIARNSHTSIQEIRTINALKENQEPSPGTPLLVSEKSGKVRSNKKWNILLLKRNVKNHIKYMYKYCIQSTNGGAYAFKSNGKDQSRT